MIRLILSALLLSSSASAFTASEQLGFELKEAPKFCETIRSEHKSWGASGEMPEAHRTRATELLGVCNAIAKEFPDSLIKTIDEALKADEKTTVATYMAISNSGCAKECLAIADGLLKTKQDPTMKTAALRFLCKPKLPSVGTANAELATFVAGQKYRVWTLSAAQQKLLAEIKSEIAKAEQKSGGVLAETEDALVKQVETGYELSKPIEKRTLELCGQLQ